MRKKYTLREICELENMPIPEEFMSQADEEISGITCFGSRAKKDGALFPRGLTEQGKKASRGLNERGARAAVKKGVKFVFSEEQYFDEDGSKLPCVVIKNPRETFIKLCQNVRDGFSPKTVTLAVTGSIGKTTTTEMVGIVATRNRNTYFSKKNTNGFASIANHMQQVTDDIEVYIQEVGAYFPGLIEDGATILKPDACIVTNIGPSHIDLYGSLDNIAYDKLALARHLTPDGMAILNYDDPILRRAELNCNITWFSLNDSAADYYADNIEYHEGYIEYDIIGKGECQHIVLSCYGFHNIINSIAAYAMGRWLGLTGVEIASSLSKFKVEGMRENLCNVGGYRLFIDCFNAAPNSLEGAIKTILNIKIEPGKKRIAVLGDMLKMGDLSEQLHTDCGKVLSKYDVDLFICYGPYMAYMAKELEAAGKKVLYTNDREQLNKYIVENSKTGDLILFKAGHKMALAKSIDAIFGTSYYISDIDVIMEKGQDFKDDTYSGKIIDNMIDIRKCLVDSQELTVPSQIGDYPVYRIGADSFNRKKELETLEIEEGVVNIGFAAFYLCTKLRNLKLPNSLKYIEKSAFNYCSSLEEVVIPENVLCIERKAFYECKELKKIYIGKNVRSIGELAFAKCPKLTIYGEKGSYAEAYAKKSRITFEAMVSDVENEDVKADSVEEISTSCCKCQTITANGKSFELSCPICQGKDFTTAETVLQNSLSQYVCDNCGYLLNFIKK